MARKLVVEIIGDARSLENAFKKSSKSADKFGRNMTGTARVTRGAFGGMSSAVSALGVTLGAAGIVTGIKSAVNAASDLNEEINKSTVIFGESGQELIRWSKTTANAIGLSQRAALEGAGGFGGMFKAIGLGEAQSAKMSKSLVQLAADMASMQNQDPSEMLLKLRAGLAGEAEPLRRFAVFIDEASVKAQAYRDGIARTGSELTQGQKVQARYNLILRQAAFQMGDFENTSKSWANVQRRVRAIVEDTAAKIGADLTPKLAEAGDKLALWLSDTENQERVQRALTDGVKAATAATKGFVAIIKALRAVLGPVVDLLGGTENAVKGLAIAFGVFKTAQLGSSLANIASNFGLIGRDADKAAGKTKLLRGRLLALVANPYTATIAIVAVGAAIVAKKIKDLQKMQLEAETQTFKKGSGLETTLVPSLAKDITKMKAAGKTGMQIITELRKRLGGSLKADDLITEAFQFQSGSNPKLKARIQKAIRETKKTVEKTARDELKKGPTGATIEQRNQWWDTMLGRRLSRVQDIRSLAGQLKELDRVVALLRARIAKTKDITRLHNLEDQLLDVQREMRSVRAQQREVQQQAVEDARQAAAGRASFAVERAEATRGLGDDLRALQAQQSLLQRQLRETGRNLDLERDIFAVRQRISEVRAAQRRSRFFLRLGLTAEGEERVPGVKALQAELRGITRGIDQGLIKVGSATRKRLKEISRILREGDPGRAVREAIKGILDPIKDGAKKTDVEWTKFRSVNSKQFIKLAGLQNLPAAQRQSISTLLARMGPGMTLPAQRSVAFAGAGARGGMTISGGVHLHGVQNVPQFENELARRAKARPHRRRGAS